MEEKEQWVLCSVISWALTPSPSNPPLVMTGHKKQSGWRGMEEYREIERVRPQHLPRVTTSPRGVLTTDVLAVHCFPLSDKYSQSKTPTYSS